MDLLSLFIHNIKSEQLFTATDRILVAVSGGVDSVVMTHMLKQSGYDLGIVHVNYQLRGRQSDLDQDLVERIASRLNLPVYIKGFDTETYARDQGISIQMAARELRYPWFEEIRSQKNFQKIATAHHLNDVLETLLLNLTKGTGIAGLHGILPIRGALVRPLLFAPKQDILEYAKQNGLEWREDQSNQNDYYQRNLIRHQVVPLLKQINPDLESTVGTTVKIIRSVERLYQQGMENLRVRLMQRDGEHVRISKSSLQEVETAIFADLMREFGFNFDQCQQILGEALTQPGRIFLSRSYTLNVDREDIIISPNTGGGEVVTIINRNGKVSVGDHQWYLTEHHAKDYQIHGEDTIACFDLDKLIFPLDARPWQQGDRFYPLGMNHRKKVSDFLIDEKVPRNFKDRALILLSGNEVIWVVGYRIDNRFRVTEETQRILEIRILPVAL